MRYDVCQDRKDTNMNEDMMKETRSKGDIKSRGLSDMLHDFMEGHAPLFWIIFSVVTVLVIYKSFSLIFLEKTPYTWDDVFQHYTLALLCIILMRESYKGQFHLGFRIERFGLGLLLCWPAIPFMCLNLLTGLSDRPIVGESLVLMLLSNYAIGLFEEVVVRAILLGHMMHHYKGDRHRVLKSVLYSALLFGILHIGNALANPVNTAFQVVYATGIGVMFAAAYIRTRNLWPCIIMHALVDFCANMGRIYVQLQPDVEAYQEELMSVPSLISYYLPYEVLTMIPGIVLVGAVIISLLAALAGAFILRGSKRAEIDELWQEM